RQAVVDLCPSCTRGCTRSNSGCDKQNCEYKSVQMPGIASAVSHTNFSSINIASQCNAISGPIHNSDCRTYISYWTDHSIFLPSSGNNFGYFAQQVVPVRTLKIMHAVVLNVERNSAGYSLVILVFSGGLARRQSPKF